MSAEERAGLFTCPTKCAATHPGREHEHDPRCYQRTGVPADLPADTCDCGVWGLFHPATPDAGDASEVERDEWCICSTEFRALAGEVHTWICSQQWADLARLLAARDAAARAEERERIAQAIEARRVPRRRDNTQGQIDTREALDLAARIARGDS